MSKEQQKLRSQLRDKELEIQELQTRCVQAACEKEQAAREVTRKLQEKHEESAALGQKHFKVKILKRHSTPMLTIYVL